MNIKKPNNCLNCKAKAELVRFGGGYYQCRCTGCGSLGRLTPYKSDAVKYWNEEHRPEPETLPENVGFVSISADEYRMYLQAVSERQMLLSASRMAISHLDSQGGRYVRNGIEGLRLVVNQIESANG